jgi:peptidyl-Lys metalloendopeptidase
MKRLNQIGLCCAFMVMGWLLGACAPTPTGEAVEPSPLGLSATLAMPSQVPDGERVVLTFNLTNNSNAGLYVLTWYTPLEGLGGEIFRVERDGQPLPYEGPLAMRGDPTPEAYVFLDAGASVSATVDLATAYDFSQAGEYTIEFLSPRISHVARTKEQMATSVDELGPVAMPSNQVSVTVEEDL